MAKTCMHIVKKDTVNTDPTRTCGQEVCHLRPHAVHRCRPSNRSCWRQSSESPVITAMIGECRRMRLLPHGSTTLWSLWAVSQEVDAITASLLIGWQLANRTTPPTDIHAVAEKSHSFFCSDRISLQEPFWSKNNFCVIIIQREYR